MPERILTANLVVTFYSGGAADRLTAQLTRYNGTTQPNDSQTVRSNGGTISFDGVLSQDVIGIDGLCLGTAKVTIDIPVLKNPLPKYPSGHIFDNLIVK
jgi:hypothetical protein